MSTVYYLCVLILNVGVQAGLHLCRVRGQLLGVALLRQFVYETEFLLCSSNCLCLWSAEIQRMHHHAGCRTVLSIRTEACSLSMKSECACGVRNRAWGLVHLQASSINHDITRLLEIEAALQLAAMLLPQFTEGFGSSNLKFCPAR